MRQDLQNINTAKLAVVVADILIGLFLSKCHGCSASGGTPTLGGWDGLREMGWKKDGQENKLAVHLLAKGAGCGSRNCRGRESVWGRPHSPLIRFRIFSGTARPGPGRSCEIPGALGSDQGPLPEQPQ